jgi:hypothetical protein
MAGAGQRLGDGTVEHARFKHYLVGYQEIKCLMVFDIKVENLVRKACFVAIRPRLWQL